MSNTFYVTTPIYYANGDPHLGTVYTTTICDVLARYHRLRGDDTFFLTGTDEHGIKMEKAAQAAGVQPIELATKYANLFRDVWDELKISYDDFIRTTEDRHKSAVQNIVRKLVDSGDIYLGSYEGWYDEGQEEFVTETEAKTNEFKSKISGKPLTRYSEPTYFFRLSNYRERVIAHIESHPHFIVPESRRNEVLSKLRAGIADLSISRATLQWGIPLPHDPKHVVYVWIDALTNYITALGYGSDEATKRRSDEGRENASSADPSSLRRSVAASLFQKFWPANVHVIGKDILWFHTVYWPALLLSLGLKLPDTIAAHGWWVSGGRKAGKSTGGITPLSELREIASTYNLDALRYYLLRAGPFGSDLEWSQEEFDRAFNELANVIGNGLNRTVKMINRYRGGILPAAGELQEIDRNLVEQTKKLSALVEQAYARLELQQVALLPIELARATNGFIDATAPFTLAKDPSQASRLDTVLNLSAQAIKNALVALLPLLPEKAEAGMAQLGVSIKGKTLSELSENLPDGTRVAEGVPLFPKVETKGAAK